MKMKPLVHIILSTYNGEYFLDEQINSLLNQDYDNFKIIIRDDGSTDNTIKILQKYSLDSRISIIFGSNIGVVNSFYELILLSAEDCEYISFCDQDDYWESDKLSSSIRTLLSYSKIPSLYCSRLMITDQNLNIIKVSRMPKKISFENALVENVVTGCTIVINRKLRDMLIRNIPKNALMHDWWIYMVASSFGKVIFDSNPKISYRQHKNNVIGLDYNFFSYLKKRFLNIRKKKSEYTNLKLQIQEFYNFYSNELRIEERNTIIEFLKNKKFSERIIFSLKTTLFRQSFFDNLIFKFLIILGVY